MTDFSNVWPHLDPSIKEAVCNGLVLYADSHKQRVKLLAPEGTGIVLSDQIDRTNLMVESVYAAVRELLDIPKPESTTALAWADVTQYRKEAVYDFLLQAQANYRHQAKTAKGSGLLEQCQRGEDISASCWGAAIALGYQDPTKKPFLDRVVDKVQGAVQTMVMTAMLKDGLWVTEWKDASALEDFTAVAEGAVEATVEATAEPKAKRKRGKK